MNRHGNMFVKVLALLVVGIMCVSSLTICLADAYSEYSNAYMTLMSNGLIDANLDVTLTMDGQTNDYSGHMKVDSIRNLMVYEMSSGGQNVVSFTDGTWLYTDMNGEKIKFNLEAEDTEQTEPEEPGENDVPDEDDVAPTFSVKEFISNFSSLLEPGQIAQLGLLSPINEIVVSNTDKSGNTYTLNIADGLAKVFLNTLAASLAEDQEATVEFTDLKNLSYQATVENDVVTSTTYGGDLTVHVPAKLMSSGSDADYQLTFKIKISFNNPGNEAQFELPSTDGYEEVELPD